MIDKTPTLPEPVAYTTPEVLAEFTEPHGKLGIMGNSNDRGGLVPLYTATQLSEALDRAERVERERDWQYDENVNRIAKEAAAESRATTAEAALEGARKEQDRFRRMVERRDEFIISKGLWEDFKEAGRDQD